MCNCACRRRWAAKGVATNPEQLFAVGYAACFESALGIVERRERVDVGDVSIDSRVSLLPNRGSARRDSNNRISRCWRPRLGYSTGLKGQEAAEPWYDP